jgi:hypothetical protein
MARYGEELRNRAVAKPLLQGSACMRAMVKEAGAGVDYHSLGLG